MSAGLKKKVLVVNDAREFGGAEESIVRLFRRFLSDEFELLLLCPPGSALAGRFRGDPRLRTGGFPRFKISWFRLGNRKVTNPLAVFANGFRLLQAVALVRRQVRRDRVAIVLSTNDPSHFYCGPAARMAGSASVWWLSNLIPREQAFGMIYALFNLFRRFFCDRVVCISRSVRDSLEDRADSEVVYYPVRELPGTFSPRAECLRKYELEGWRDNLLVGMACRLVLWKGVQVLIASAPKILEKFPRARFLILGDSPHEGHKKILREKIRGLGLEGAFILYGFVENPLELLNCLEVCVHTSIVPEPFGLTVLDYMQLGKAIVAAREGGISEMLDKDSAVLVKSGDPAALAEGICRLLKSPELRHRMGKRARECAVRRFSPEAFSTGMAIQFQEVSR